MNATRIRRSRGQALGKILIARRFFRRARVGIVTMVVVAAPLAVQAGTVSPAHAAAGEVLILDSTVSGGAGSTLAQKFVAAGKTPVVVSDAQWASMTASDFGAYDAIVLGDPTCSITTPSVAEANASVWSSVVDGNVIAIGSDETFHESQGGADLMTSAAAFSVAEAGKTGAYISLSCYYHDTAPGTPVPLLSGFGTFTTTGVGCYNDAHIVATHPALTGLTDATLSNWSCSVHEAFDAFPLSFEVLAIAQGIGTSFTATDGSVGTPYILARGVDVISDIHLTPATANKTVGTSHTVTATVTTDTPSPGTPVVGTTVTFTVIAGPHAGTTGTGTTDALGVATFSYTGAAVGEDTIEATFLDSLARTQRSNRVTATWAPAANIAPVIGSSPASVQYSDVLPSTMLASATDADSNPLTMSSSALPASLAGSDNGTGGFLVSGTATAVPAAYPVTYTASDGTVGSTSSSNITITKEDCTLTAPINILSSAAGSTTLTATMGELDASVGNLGGKTVSFSGVDASSAPVGPFTGTTNASGIVNVSVPLPEGVYVLNATFAGDAYYYNCQTTSETIVTVTPVQFKVTGGGYITQGTGRTSFGFNAKSDVSGLRGQLQLRTANKAKFHSDVVLTLTGSGNTATWTGTGKWNGAAGYTFTAIVVDNGTSGKKGDTISLVVKTSGGSTVFTTGGAVALKGGNIVVH